MRRLKLVEVIIEIIMGALLLAAGIMDIRKREISRIFIVMLFVAAAADIAISIYKADSFSSFDWWQTAGGFSIGICAIGISVISREQIGRGDGLVIAALGLMLGFSECLSVVCIASVIMALVSIIVLIIRKGNRNTRLPFIPALFASYALCMAVGI